MHAHFILAHPEPNSFNGHLMRCGRRALEQDGWSVTVSDLYAMGFDPAERADHYQERLDPGRFDVQAEQRHASTQGTLPLEVRNELDAIDRCDLLILQYPMWWHLPPAMLKDWFDRVFAYGAAYTSARRFEDGRFRGRRALLSVTVGTSRETYMHDGRSGDIDLLLWPVNFSLAYVGFEVLEPFVSYGVEAGLAYSDPAAMRDRLSKNVADFEAMMTRLESRASIPFNRKAEWGPDGRIVPEARAHSPFIRHSKILGLG